ncbi:MAG: Coenzyme F420 hydrogenase/dehydrogenase, beta subunit C-terminal domain [Pseudomonadota bacterium]
MSLHTPDLAAPAARGLCTDCGLSRLPEAGKCGRACQFIRPDYPRAEAKVHGRPRDPGHGDERFFGHYRSMYRARLRAPSQGAQWTGITTRIAERLLETGRVEAVLTVAPDAHDRWRPVPVLVTDPADMAKVRGMRMGYAPVLALLDEVRRKGFSKIAVIAIPCQVYPLRAIEADLGLTSLYVIGTPCSDNTTTEAFHHFLSRLDRDPDRITYLEFRADYRVELRFDDGTQREIPFLNLPISDLPPDFFPLTCRTCVDYTNTLADITVGYMGGEGDQWLIVRNGRGEEMVGLLGDDVVLTTPGSRGKRLAAVRGFVTNTERAAGGLPLRRMPRWLRPIVSWLQPRTGPRGLEFARARLEMKAAETILHLRRHMPARMKNMIPAHVWSLAEPYGLVPRKGETRDPVEDTTE